MRLRLVLGLLLLAGPPAVAEHFNWAGQVVVDAEGLHSDDPKKRLDAVALLGNDDIHLAEPFLMKALHDDDEGVRHQAARALGVGGSAAAVPTLVDWLSDPDAKTRAVAAEALGDIGGPKATQALIRSLGDADATVRQSAVKALGKIGLHGNRDVVVALIPRLDDDKSDVRRETIEQLEQLGDRRAVIPLVARFDDTSPETRKAAVRAVGRLGDRRAVPALIRLMSDASVPEDTRTFAVGSLGLLGSPDALDALTEQLDTGSDVFRAKVAYALGQIAASPDSGAQGEEAMKTLVAKLAQPATREAARTALRIAAKSAVPALVAHLTGHIPGDPTTAVELLGETADARATAALTAELERGRVAMPLVLKALGATHDPAALVPVLGELSNKDPAIRLAAMDALRPLLGSDARAGDVLIERLDDDDLEVRVLAAEYLGILQDASAEKKLAALAGPGNPTRLRHAAIDALGEIGDDARAPEVGRALLDVLREGPAELHGPAATALAYIDDAALIPELVAQARADRSPTRDEVVRALGASLRGHPDASARALLRTLAEDSDITVADAAICGLAAARDPSDAPLLRAMTVQAASDRRRAAAWALGELHDLGAYGVLGQALSSTDDRLVGDAAWALGELAASAPADPQVAPLVPRWLYVAKHGGWAGSIDATAALARTLWALPRAARDRLVAGDRRAALDALTFHHSRLVRMNAALALSSFTGDADAAKVLARLVRDDPSPHVRVAAAQGLARAAVGASGAVAATIRAALDGAAGDPDPAVQAAAKAPAPAMPARTEWRTYDVVDRGADDAPVREEAYFVHTPDGLVRATFTDARGQLGTEHAPPGDADVWAATSEDEY